MELYQEVLDKAKLLWREELSPAEELTLSELCQAACFELQGRLKEEVSAEKIREQFVRAAASLGISMFIEFDINQVDSYSAGKLAVKRRSAKASRDAARSLRRQAELMLIGFLQEQSFDFKAVRG